MRLRTIGLSVALAVLWVALWETPSVANVAAGAAVAVLVLVLVPASSAASPQIRPLRVIQFVTVFVVKLFQANLIVAWEVVTPRNRLREGIVAVPLRARADGLRTVVANAVSLTPGTISIDLDPASGTLYVHVLHLVDPATTRREVHALEDLAITALGTAEDRRALADRRTAEPGGDRP